jgi:hypothetical protein
LKTQIIIIKTISFCYPTQISSEEDGSAAYLLNLAYTDKDFSKEKKISAENNWLQDVVKFASFNIF